MRTLVVESAGKETSARGTSLPIIDVRFGGEFRRESGLVLLSMSLSILTQSRSRTADLLSWGTLHPLGMC
jgi:hypothetical protein